MAQVMLLMGLLLAAFLIQRAIRFLWSWLRRTSAGGRGQTVDRPALAIERNITEEQQKLAMLRQKKDDLDQRIAVLERLIIEPAPSGKQARSGKDGESSDQA